MTGIVKWIKKNKNQLYVVNEKPTVNIKQIKSRGIEKDTILTVIKRKLE